MRIRRLTDALPKWFLLATEKGILQKIM